VSQNGRMSNGIWDKLPNDLAEMIQTRYGKSTKILGFINKELRVSEWIVKPDDAMLVAGSVATDEKGRPYIKTGDVPMILSDKSEGSLKFRYTLRMLGSALGALVAIGVMMLFLFVLIPIMNKEAKPAQQAGGNAAPADQPKPAAPAEKTREQWMAQL